MLHLYSYLWRHSQEWSIFESCLYACIFNTRLLLCDINWKRYLSKISRNKQKTFMGPTWDIYIYKGLFLHNSLKGTLSHYEPLIRIPKMINNDYANLLLCSLYVRLRNWREKGKKAIRYFCIRITHWSRNELCPRWVFNVSFIGNKNIEYFHD